MYFVELGDQRQAGQRLDCGSIIMIIYCDVAPFASVAIDAIAVVAFTRPDQGPMGRVLSTSKFYRVNVVARRGRQTVVTPRRMTSMHDHGGGGQRIRHVSV